MGIVIKSIVVIIVIAILFSIAVWLAFSAFRTKRHITGKLLCCALFVLILAFLVPYADPREKNVDLQLYCVLEAATQTDNRPIDALEWYAIYESFGLGTESRFNRETVPNVQWRDLDLGKHTYIVSFGREIDHLSYNIWDSKLPAILDLGSSYKVGHVQFSSEIDSSKIYVYEIDHLRIDHDIDETAGRWP